MSWRHRMSEGTRTLIVVWAVITILLSSMIYWVLSHEPKYIELNSIKKEHIRVVDIEGMRCAIYPYHGISCVPLREVINE